MVLTQEEVNNIQLSLRKRVEAIGRIENSIRNDETTLGAVYKDLDYVLGRFVSQGAAKIANDEMQDIARSLNRAWADLNSLAEMLNNIAGDTGYLNTHYK